MNYDAIENYDDFVPVIDSALETLRLRVKGHYPYAVGHIVGVISQDESIMKFIGTINGESIVPFVTPDCPPDVVMLFVRTVSVESIDPKTGGRVVKTAHNTYIETAHVSDGVPPVNDGFVLRDPVPRRRIEANQVDPKKPKLVILNSDLLYAIQFTTESENANN